MQSRVPITPSTVAEKQGHEYKALAGVGKRHDETFIGFVRELTPEESVRLAAVFHEYGVAKSKFRLFQILDANYADWKRLIGELSAPEPYPGDEMLELDRRISNYLTAARSLIEHFLAYYAKTYPEARRGFSDFLRDLSSRVWVYAFFHEFRNYVQHQGLPTGSHSRKHGVNGVEIKVTVSAASLLGVRANWGASGLNLEHGDLDLIALLDEYHRCLLNEIGVFLAHAFFPKVVQAHKVCAGLADEVHRKYPCHTAIAVTEFPSRDMKVSNVQFAVIPTDVLAELGIHVAITFDEPNK